MQGQSEYMEEDWKHTIWRKEIPTDCRAVQSTIRPPRWCSMRWRCSGKITRNNTHLSRLSNGMVPCVCVCVCVERVCVHGCAVISDNATTPTPCVHRCIACARTDSGTRDQNNIYTTSQIRILLANNLSELQHYVVNGKFDSVCARVCS